MLVIVPRSSAPHTSKNTPSANADPATRWAAGPPQTLAAVSSTARHQAKGVSTDDGGVSPLPLSQRYAPRSGTDNAPGELVSLLLRHTPSITLLAPSVSPALLTQRRTDERRTSRSRLRHRHLLPPPPSAVQTGQPPTNTARPALLEGRSAPLSVRCF